METRHVLRRALSIAASLGLVAGVLVASAPSASADGGPLITSDDHATFTEGVYGSFTVVSSGDPTPTIHLAENEPPGLTFQAYVDGTAAVYGTPLSDSAGDYSLTFTASNGTPPDATQDFTLTVNPPSAISSTVWNDLNGNGHHDSGVGSNAPPVPGGSVGPDAQEFGAPDVTVCIDEGLDGQCDGGDPSVQTDANGLYEFDGLPAGSFRVQLVIPSGWVNTAIGNITNWDVTTYPGETSSGYDFFIQQQSGGEGPPQLTLNKSASPDPVQELNPITYTLDVGNNGPGDAQGVVVTDTLPPGTTFDSSSTTQGACSHTATSVTCSLGTLPESEATQTVTIIVQAPDVTTDTLITNHASVSAGNANTVNASADSHVLANTGGSTQGEAPPGATVPLRFTTSTASTADGSPAVDGTDPTAVGLTVPPGGPGGSILLEELPCATSPCSGPGSGPRPASVVLGGVVFNVVPPAGYPNGKPFKATLLYDASLNPTKGPVYYFKDGVSVQETRLHTCRSLPPGGKVPCLVLSKKLNTSDPLTDGDWKVVVRLHSDPRMHR
jgi:uncharacterized repeat protein (TIGR01451 family)